MPNVETGPFQHVEGFEEAARLDSEDPLCAFRDHYVITDPGLIYLDGNSLGRQPETAGDIIRDVTESQWGDRLIRSWNEGWWELQLRLGDLMAPIVGASPGEVIISDSTSVNAYKLADAAATAMRDRSRIVTDDLNFPTDVHVLAGIAQRHGKTLEIVASDGVNGPIEGLQGAVDSDTALLSLSHTAFKSGYTYDMAALTEMAHEVGAMVLWDCSHSVGALPIDFESAGVDLAIGCTYKYLNGGPGSPAFLYVRSDLQDELDNPIQAWWGHADPFGFELDFEAVRGIRRFHTGTMPILSLAAAEAGISDVLDAGIERIRAKSVAQSDYMIGQWDTHLRDYGFRLASPSDSSNRGSHVSLSHPEAWPMTRALIEVANVIPDFRTPDNIRFGLSPLYNSFVEIHTAVQRLRRIAEGRYHVKYMDVKATVT